MHCHETSAAEWTEEVDVIVVGLGLAGMAAALEASECAPQSRILLLEKMSADFAGGNSRASGQTFCFPVGLEDFLTYQRHMNEPNPVDDSALVPWAREIIDLEPWVRMLAEGCGREFVRIHEGAVIPDFPDLPSSRCIQSFATINPGPSGVWTTFRDAVRQRPIDVRFSTRVTELIQEPSSGEVLGVVAHGPEGHIRARARQGVVLCSGGYGANLKMLRNYTGVSYAVSAGSPASTGDGVTMLQRVGAEMWHLRNFTQSGGYYPGFLPEGYNTPFLRRMNLSGNSWLEIGADGRRFHDEKAPYGAHHMKYSVNGVWRDAPHPLVQPVHMIFDRAMLDIEPLVTSAMGWNAQVLGHTWSQGNLEELLRGWIFERDTTTALAEAIGVEPAVLKRTIDCYNQTCDSGHDDEHGRTAPHLARINGPPYFALQVVPCLVNTTGGGQRNGQGQVLNVRGEPILGLFTAGELGSLHSNLYQGGLFLTEAVASGRLAGRHVVDRASS